MNLFSKKAFPIFLLLILVAFACKDDEPDMNIDNEPNDELTLEDFIGSYDIETTHISGVQTFYDSVGNQIGQGFDTTLVTNQLLVIETGNSADTLLVNGLINGFNHGTSIVEAVLEGDVITVIYDFSEPQLRHDFIKGTLRLDGDSIILVYQWDRSDIWSYGALPERGEVRGGGIRN